MASSPAGDPGDETAEAVSSSEDLGDETADAGYVVLAQPEYTAQNLQQAPRLLVPVEQIRELEKTKFGPKILAVAVDAVAVEVKREEAQIANERLALESDIEARRTAMSAAIDQSGYTLKAILFVGLVLGSLSVVGGFALVATGSTTPGAWFAGGGVAGVVSAVLLALNRHKFVFPDHPGIRGQRRRKESGA